MSDIAIANAAVNSLVASGADAMDNMYEVGIRFPWDTETSLITVRAEGFEPPVSKSETYEKEYHGQKISLPSTKATLERSFDITFSFDATWNLWGKFSTWKASIDDATTGGKANFPGLLGEIIVASLAGAYIATTSNDALKAISPIDGTAGSGVKWEYQMVYVSEVTNPSFKTKGGDAMTYKVTFKYFDEKTPFTNGKGLDPSST